MRLEGSHVEGREIKMTSARFSPFVRVFLFDGPVVASRQTVIQSEESASTRRDVEADRKCAEEGD